MPPTVVSKLMGGSKIGLHWGKLTVEISVVGITEWPQQDITVLTLKMC